MRRVSARLCALTAALVFALVGEARRCDAQELGKLVSPGPLSSAHAAIEGLEKCEKCHEPGKGVAASRCLSCHQPIAQRIAQKRGVHRAVANDCASCHTEHAGHDADIRPIDVKHFDHLAETGFALDGRHAAIAADCAKCHTTRSYLTARPECESCHKDPHHGTLGNACASCHSTSVPFKETKTGFDHSKTAFALTGAHRTVACEKCHAGGKLKGIAFAECSSCHTDPHRGRFGPACSSCHTTDTIRTQKVNHDLTAYPLVGKHASVACVACHVQPATKVKLRFDRCVVCHQDPHHGKFSDDCASCHQPSGFRDARFDHATRTKFALTGRHAEIPCARCHTSAATTAGPARAVEFRAVPTACEKCHTDPHAGTLGANCQSCHDTRTFRVTTFQHARFPAFFAGQHSGVECAKCHGGEGVTRDGLHGSAVAARTYRGLSTACASCHRDIHLGQLGNECQTCHTIAAAKFAAPAFDHSRAAFPLAGKHAGVECAKCHKRETGSFPAGTGEAIRFKGVGTECVSCHRDPHLGQLGTRCQECHSPTTFTITHYTHRGHAELFTGRHAEIECAKCHRQEAGAFPAGQGSAVRFAGLGTACASCHQDAHHGDLGDRCESCHSPTHWQSASRAFHKATQFPLQGRHLEVPCASCHIKGVLKGTPTRCYDCHWIRRQDDLYKTRLGNECEQCHNPTAWTAVSWNHGAATGFALNAAHRGLACYSCHKDETFHAGLSLDCYGCHREDFAATRTPNHAAAGFPTTCATCHRASDPNWQTARFDHASVFPLVGVHAAQACASCHQNNVYKGTPRDCVGCHLTAFQQAANPNHVAAAFAQTCQDCHNASDTSFGQGRFAHSMWPLVGAHATRACRDCHGDNVFHGKPTACVPCHQADYEKTTNPSHVAAGFPVNCETCHKVTDTVWTQATFDHSAVFPLVGVHATQPCATCHKNNVYQGTSRECVGCHLTNFQQAANPNHVAAAFAQTCQDCHNAGDASWAQGRYAHTAWPLQGAHVTRACRDCHGDSVFHGKGTACVTCHLTDYQKTTNPSHATAGFSTACETCHKVSDTVWTQATFDHSTIFPLVGVHATQPCAACHINNVYQGTATACVGCHQAKYQQTTIPNHAAAGFDTNCQTCHNASDAAWTQGRYAHTTWPLQGAHAARACADCHGDNVFHGKGTACVTCHLTDYQKTTNPNHATAGFPTTCETCHKVSDMVWTQATFDHSTVFQLVGVHATQPCVACHINNVYQGTPTTCVGCHLTKYQQATNPNHTAAGFDTNCQTCHNATDAAWTQGRYAHTTWPLQGAHATRACADCHGDNVFHGKGTACVTCHLTDYQHTTNPPHAAAGFPTTCELCHKVSDANWNLATFDHSTVFPLVGVHATQPCVACHINNVYQGTPTTCVGCHLAKYQQATNPNHPAAGFDTTCQTCHNATDAAWTQGRYAHSSWPLVGAHATRTCTDCHGDNVYQGKSTTCVTCHLTDYQHTTNPPHAAAGFPTTCETCHKVSDTNWNQATFNHNQIYPLVGVHATQPCAACHINGVYQGTPTTCVGCHLAKYQQATNPNHTAAGFDTNCQTCHNAADPVWTQGRYAHTTWPLVGAHATRTCTDCHGDNVYQGKSAVCVTCHLTDYQHTTNPPHAAAGFPTTCETCHKVSDTNWNQATFNHSTIYPLLGVHATQPCAACHINGVYQGTPTTCVGCHLAKYQQATNPNHTAAGFDTNCQTCHNAADPVWTQGRYAHSSWPLVGAHAIRTCIDCHGDNVYQGKSTACVTCHLSDYQGTTNPNHAAAGFPTTCELCHKVSDTNWNQGVFNHTTFYPLVGVHATQPCAACHINNVYPGTPTTCVGCHLAKYQQATNPNHTAAGFDTNCQTCHNATDTVWTQGRYAHSSWPLVGAHATRTCIDCHGDNVYQGKSSACVTCHLSDYQNTTNPNHAAAGFPTTCELCHKVSDTSWTQGTFNHIWFPRNHGNSGGVCSVCHTNPSNFAVFSCTTGCHPRSQTDNNHRGVSGYVYDSNACYSCHPRGQGG